MRKTELIEQLHLLPGDPKIAVRVGPYLVDLDDVSPDPVGGTFVIETDPDPQSDLADFLQNE